MSAREPHPEGGCGGPPLCQWCRAGVPEAPAAPLMEAELAAIEARILAESRKNESHLVAVAAYALADRARLFAEVRRLGKVASEERALRKATEALDAAGLRLTETNGAAEADAYNAVVAEVLRAASALRVLGVEP